MSTLRDGMADHWLDEIKRAKRFKRYNELIDKYKDEEMMNK